MKKNYIKLNNNTNHLSIGNLFNIIKNNSKNKTSAIQTEIFCILFNIDSIAETTVNNYCTGYRSIGSSYKQIYLNYEKKYQKDKTILMPTINNILSIIDGQIRNYKSQEEINESQSLKKLVYNLHNLAKNDIDVKSIQKKQFLTYISNKNYYEALCNMLFFIILEKKQPIYESELVLETIEEILDNTNMSVNDLKKYLEIHFKEGFSLIHSLKKLAKSGNPYALYDLGCKEFNGEISGERRYDLAYKYHIEAAKYNHPTSNWFIAHMILNKKIGALSKDDLSLALDYLEKAISLNSVSAINTKGLCYLNGWNKEGKINVDEAIKYFKMAANKNYIYAFNNLGKIYEEKKEYEKAFSYYLKSAEEEESWACNKVGLCYYNGLGTTKDIEKAFYYFTIGASAPKNTRINWNIYNLVKLFYLNGNATLNIKKDIEKSISLLDSIKDFDLANELFLYSYYEKYLENKTEENLTKVKYYLNIIDSKESLKIKKSIEANLKKINDYHININL